VEIEKISVMSKEKKVVATSINIKVEAVNLKIDTNTPSKAQTTTKKKVVKKNVPIIKTEIKRKNSIIEQKPISARKNKYTTI
jgi:hypothetical protein